MGYVDLTQPYTQSSFKPNPSRSALHRRSLYTRVEAPRLLFRNGKTIDAYPPERFFRSAVLLDLQRKKPRSLIDDEDLEAAEEAAGLSIREGEAVILQTGWDKFHSKRAQYHNHPGLSENAAEFLRFKGIGTVGIDGPSIELNDERLAVHSIFMRQGVLVLENLCNLTGVEGPRFQLLAAPLKGRFACSPARVIAVQSSD